MQELFKEYCGMRRVGPDGHRYEIHTQEIVVEAGICASIADVAEPYLGSSSAPVAVVYDDNTLRAAGSEVLASFANAADSGRRVEAVCVPPAPGKETVSCDDRTVDDVTKALGSRQVGAAVAVGSGTVTDLVKMGAHRLGIPVVSVPTAPSNNGYTSAIAAILSDGVKTTQPCTPVAAVFADTEVLRRCPYRMIASGIGDLYSKPVSNADWRLSYRLNDTFFSTIVMEIVDAGNALLEGVAPRLPSRNSEAVAALTGAIMLSGLGMQAAGSSGPASGGEHLVSHYLDMTAEKDGEPHDLHGCQVAVGTVVTATLYDWLREIDPATIDVDACCDRHPSWEAQEAVLRDRFGTLADGVISHARKAYADTHTLRARLERLLADWHPTLDWVSETLRPHQELAAELESADCPVRFDQIGVSKDRAYRAIAHSKDIRNRYTILHLLAEIGVLEEWARRLV